MHCTLFLVLESGYSMYTPHMWLYLVLLSSSARALENPRKTKDHNGIVEKRSIWH